MKYRLRLKDALPTIEEALIDSQSVEMLIHPDNSHHLIIDENQMLDIETEGGEETSNRRPGQSVRCWFNECLNGFSPDQIIQITIGETELA